jgi:hypothetical protein
MKLLKTLQSFGIHPKFFGEMRALVEHGTRPSQTLRTRLKQDYKPCLDSLLAELSQPILAKHFPEVTHAR